MSTTDVSRNFRVVCLGGSAGALEAYLEILRGLPAETGMAFVVAPHRAVENAHLLPKILATVTKMPVVEIEQGMQLEPDRVFLMPPRMELTTDGNVFHLRAIPRARGWPKTLNVFLYSLAEAVGARAVAVILSGLDADGSAALKAIKAAGGVAVAQSDPSVTSMPQNALKTGHVDYLLPAAGIAKALLDLAGEPLEAA